jgi:TonB-dependent SusC/RagA subfamily outer membrane receptor
VVGVFFPAGGPVLTTTSDNNGRFAFDNITVKNGDPFYIVAKDKSKELIVTIDKYVPPAIPDGVLADTVELNESNAYLFERITELKNQNILGTELKEVLIQEKVAEQTLKEVLRERSSNMGGRPDQVLNFIDLLGCNNSTLGGCLALKLNGVSVVTDSNRHGPQLVLRGRNTEPMAVFVNGIERKDALATLAISEVASVEVLKGSNAAAYGMRSGNGVVVITTKAGGLDYWAYEQEHYVPGSTKIPPVRLYRFENGFDVARDFYLPDYRLPQKNALDKWRPTIYWNPNLLTGADGKGQISYFTNSAPGTYRVTIEGIDGNGRIARQVFRYTVSN